MRLARYNRNRMEDFLKGRNSVVHSDPEILGGTPVFVGTRVPLRNLIDYFEGGAVWTNSWMTTLRCRVLRQSAHLKRLMRF
jgi:hypothetical protein